MTSFSQTISADAALRRILAGNIRFTRGVAGQRNYLKELLNLADGQRPFATILGCSDSRVPPTLIFDAGLGELFVIRVAGNVFSAEIASSLQYAASHLETPLFMVLGHDNCGAIDATLKTIRSKEVDRSRIELVAEKLMPALSSIDMTQDEPQQLSCAVEANIRWTIEQILDTPQAQHRLAEGKMKIVGALYEIGTGHVRLLDEYI